MNPFETTIPALEKVTDKYTFIPTLQVCQDLQSLGFKEVRRGMPRRGQGLHYVDFVSPSLPQIDGVTFQLRLYNAHNGTSAFQFRVTLLNGVCLNILEPDASEKDLACRIVHRGYALDKLKLALQNIEQHVESIQARVARLKATQVSAETATTFAILASLRRNAKPTNSTHLLKVRHLEQAENTAWNVFNRVQEALVRGGYLTMSDDGAVTTARELQSIVAVATLNRKLWKLAERTLLTERKAA